MSTEQTQLDATTDRAVSTPAERARAVLDGRGAAYAASADGRPQRERERPTRTCLGDDCGRDVPREVARVMGDDDGNVPACPDCHDDANSWSLVIRKARGLTVGGERQ